MGVGRVRRLEKQAKTILAPLESKPLYTHTISKIDSEGVLLAFIFRKDPIYPRRVIWQALLQSVCTKGEQR